MRVIGIGFFSLVFGNNTIEIGIELETKNVSFQPEKLELNWTNIIKSTFSPVQLELLLNWTSLAWNRSWIGIYFCQNCTSLTWTDGWMPLVVDCGLSFNIGIIFTYISEIENTTLGPDVWPRWWSVLTVFENLSGVHGITWTWTHVPYM